jgi:DtxR family Mn-dependent transcriptional regulator
MQEYLAEAYRIAYYQNADNPYVSTSALATVLNVSAPAVTRMVQRLQEAGYLEHKPYQGIKLTETGEQEALASIRSHRLVECFLVDVMGFGWHEVHEAADELGSIASERLVQRMEQMADFPRRCPHGEPIPSVNGFMPRIIDYPLNGITEGQDYLISRVNTHDEQKLCYFDTLGMKPGVKVRYVSRAPFNGPLQIELTGNTIHLGHELAGALRVCSEEEFEAV